MSDKLPIGQFTKVALEARDTMEPDRADTLMLLAQVTDKLNAHPSHNVQVVGGLVGAIFVAVFQGSDALHKLALLFKLFVIPEQKKACLDSINKAIEKGDEHGQGDKLFDD